MEPFSTASAFAAIVGLLAVFKNERKSASEDEYKEFISWLSDKRHNEIISLLETNTKAAVSIKAFLSLDREIILSKLEKLDEMLVYLSSKFEGISDMALSIHPASELSDQALKILKQFVASQGSKFLVSEAMNRDPVLLMLDGNTQHLEYEEPRFLEDDICKDPNGNLIPQTIVIQSGKKGGKPKKGGEPVTLPTDQIIVTDACTECIDGDNAEFQLPPCEAGYKVYGRALGKPAEPGIRKIIISAGNLLTATDGNEQDLLELGEIIGNTITPSTAPDVEATREKGKPKTVPLSDLFKFTGTICYLEEPEGFDSCNPDTDGVCRNSVEDICATDYEGDGIYDVIVLKDEFLGCPEWKKAEVDTDVWVCYLDKDFDSVFDPDEVNVPSSGEFALDCPTVEYLTAYCQYYENEWIFNIADLVEYYFGVVNDGVKLFQLRFYPIDPECFTSS